MKHERLARTQWQQFKDDDVGDQVVHRDGSGVLEGDFVRQRVNVFGWHGAEFGPGAELGQCNDAIADLQRAKTEIMNKWKRRFIAFLSSLLRKQPLTHLEVFDALANSFNFSGTLEAEDGRRFRWRVDGTQAHH